MLNVKKKSSGLHHYINQRISAIGLLFLIPWMIYNVLEIAHSQDIIRILQQKFSYLCFTLAALLLFFAGLYHGALGIKVIIEDYIKSQYIKKLMLLSLYLLTFISIVAVSVSILYYHFVLKSFGPCD